MSPKRYLRNSHIIKVCPPKCAEKKSSSRSFSLAHSCSTKINFAEKINGFKVLRVSYLYQTILISMK